jgi:hypothetical protein
VLEEPKNVAFKLFNMSVGNMNLKLDFKEATASDVKILSIENGTESLGYIKPGECKEFTLRLFALKCGLLPINGLVIKEITTGREIQFQNFT